MENAPDIKSKSFEKVLKNRLMFFNVICHFHPTQSAVKTPIHTIKCENLIHVKMKMSCILNDRITGYLDYLWVVNFRVLHRK